MNINLEDPRLSAYALGEMNNGESKEFEALLEKDPAARAEVQAIRQMAGMLASELQQEPSAGMTEEARAKVVAAAEGNIVAMPKPRARRFAASLARIAAVLLVVGGVVWMLMPQLARSSKMASNATRRFEMGQLAQPSAGPTEGSIVPDSIQGARDSSPAKPPSVSVPPAPEVEPAPAPAPAQQITPETTEQIKSMGYMDSAGGVQWKSDAAHARRQDFNPTVGGRLNIRADYTPSARTGEVMSWGTALPPGVPAPQAESRVSGGYGAFRGRDGRMGDDVEVYQAYVVVPRTQAPGTESYKPIVENEFKLVRNEPLSTFSIDVDTASYANVRRFLNDGQLPPPDAVRIEELVNYFKYDYPEPEGNSPFSVTVEANACHWNRDHALALVGLRGRSIPMDERAPINLVFLVDVSGSMQPENKLPLLKKAMRLLVDYLGEQDRVGIVTYASNTGVALPSSTGAEKPRILYVLDALQAGGSTNGAGGIQLAYEMAARNFIRGGVNRIVLATDGDFNVGISDTDQLVRFIEDKAKSGVFLSVLGFGEGNLQDDKLEGLADKGNGNYAYIDSFAEARRVLLDDVAGTMMPIAKDVKIQIEFNPARVGAYRLIGYENRILAAQDFNDDRKDAGEIGSGHTVTALYELVPPDGVGGLSGVDPLKYQGNQAEQQPGSRAVEVSPELMTVKLRYKQPDGNTSSKFDVPVLASAGGSASANLKFASSVAMFGMLLRNSQFRGAATFDMALALAEEARGADKSGQRTEFASLIQTARALAGPVHIMAQAQTPPTAPGLPPGFQPPDAAPGVMLGPGGFEQLKLDLPRPMFVGTPKNIVSDNLDPNTGKPQPPLMVPVGTRKLSQGMPVTASDEQPIIGEPEMVTDGDKEGADGSFVEFGPGVQWVQIDLGQTHEINAIAVWHFHSQARLYRDVIVRLSDDKDFIGYTEIFNNDHDNSAKLGAGRDYDYIETNAGRLIDAKAVPARYVRLYSNGNTSNDMNHMVEVEVFGR